jgi:hypothetical protein
MRGNAVRVDFCRWVEELPLRGHPCVAVIRCVFSGALSRWYSWLRYLFQRWACRRGPVCDQRRERQSGGLADQSNAQGPQLATAREELPLTAGRLAGGGVEPLACEGTSDGSHL